MDAGEPYHPADKACKLVDKVSIHYNIGHLATAAGRHGRPARQVPGRDEQVVDRSAFANVGPLHPQNFQLIDISGEKMELLADMPIGFGEPHYAQMVKADIIKAHDVYGAGRLRRLESEEPQRDRRRKRGAHRPARQRGRSLDERGPQPLHARHHHREGRPESDRAPHELEQTPDATHGFAIPTKNVMVSLDPGETTTVEFVVDKPGTYRYYCTEFCSALHLEMQGWLIIEK